MSNFPVDFLAVGAGTHAAKDNLVVWSVDAEASAPAIGGLEDEDDDEVTRLDEVPNSQVRLQCTE